MNVLTFTVGILKDELAPVVLRTELGLNKLPKENTGKAPDVERGRGIGDGSSNGLLLGAFSFLFLEL